MIYIHSTKAAKEARTSVLAESFMQEQYANLHSDSSRAAGPGSFRFSNLYAMIHWTVDGNGELATLASCSVGLPVPDGRRRSRSQ